MTVSPQANAFPIHENLSYDLKWAGLKAGEAQLEMKEDGNEVTITSRARSVPWVSVFYTVEDLVQSRLLRNSGIKGMGKPVQYRLNLREGRHRKQKEVVFDHQKGKALYIDHLENERKDFDIPGTVFDPISGFFYIRTLDLQVGKPVSVTIFDSKRVWDVEVQVLRKEKITVPAGEFQTIVVKPLMQSEGIFLRKGDVLIWLSDDERKIPVMIQTKVKIGSVSAFLTGIGP